MGGSRSSMENWLCALCSAHCPGIRAQALKRLGWDSVLGVGAGAGQVWGALGGPSASFLRRVTWGGLDRLAYPRPWRGLSTPILVHGNVPWACV